MRSPSPMRRLAPPGTARPLPRRRPSARRLPVPTAAPRIPRNAAVRFAVVGLGYFAQMAVLPAFRSAKGCRLAALVSDDATKLRELGEQYDVPWRTGYDGYDDLLRSGQVDAVYIALPNDLHADFAIRAARAGVHVLCEKPLADNARDAARIVEACRRARVRLMTAYRLHFEPANLRAIEAARNEVGEPKVFDSLFTMQVKPTGIRVEPERGGGPLLDIGIYCINAARYLFRAEPTSVVATTVDGTGKRFRGIDEAVSAVLTFPGGRVASFTASFGAHAVAYYTLLGTSGYVCVDNAYEHMEARVVEAEGSKGAWKRRYRKVDQVAPELIEFAQAIRSGRDPEPSGQEGLVDLRIIEAIERSARTGRRVAIRVRERGRRPDRRQGMSVGRQRKPRLVRAQVPFRD